MDPKYPWKCRECRKPAVWPVTVDYVGAMEYDGRTYQVRVPQLQILECGECHSRLLPDEAWVRFDEKFREQAGLLLPAQIREGRKKLDLTQRELARRLGIAEETLSRWETGAQIQQKSLDRFLRIFFGFSAVQDVLADEAKLHSLGVATAELRLTAAIPAVLRVAGHVGADLVIYGGVEHIAPKASGRLAITYSGSPSSAVPFEPGPGRVRTGNRLADPSIWE